MSHVSLQYEEQPFNPVTITLNSAHAVKVIKALTGAICRANCSHVCNLDEEDIISIQLIQDFSSLWADLDKIFPERINNTLSIQNDY